MNPSIVIAARNDDYLPRLRRSLRVLEYLRVRCEINPEVIIVEWNPSPNALSLADALTMNRFGFRIRIITVSAEIHNSMRGSDVLPFFEYVAKNVGIRRAKNDYILSTNADEILSVEMGNRFAIGYFDSDAFYRANRHDTNVGTVAGVEALELLWTARNNVYRIVKDFEGAGGDFLMMHRDRWNEMHGNPELVSDDTIDTYAIELAEAHGFKKIVLEEPIYHQGHTSQRDGWASIGGSTSPDQNVGPRKNDDSWGLAGFELPEVTI
jgi:hypothetical protein